jgi:hypothetical protein
MNHHRRFLIPFVFVLIILMSYGYIRWQTQSEMLQSQLSLEKVSSQVDLLQDAKEALGEEPINAEDLLTSITNKTELGVHGTACDQASVTDIQGHSYYQDINALIKNCIVAGYQDGTFRPNNQINRAELAKIVMGAFFSPEELQSATEYFQEQGSTYAGLPDVPLNQWYAPYIALGILEEIIKGYLGEYIVVNGIKDHPFKPGNPVTFGEAFKILLSAKIAVTDPNTREIIENELFYAANNTTDYPFIPLDDWTRPYLLTGMSENLAYMFPSAFAQFRHTPITRAQFAHLAVNVMSY